MTDPRSGWRTADEVAFIDKLGEHAELLRGVTRTQLLAQYQRALQSRKVWGAVDYHEVMRHISMARVG